LRDVEFDRPEALTHLKGGADTLVVSECRWDARPVITALSSHLSQACPDRVPGVSLERQASAVIGPVQLLIMLAFDRSDFARKMIAQLERLRDTDTVHVLDALAVYKDAAGEIELQQLTRRGAEQAVDADTTIGAVIGRVVETSWDVLDELPTDSAATLVLLRHHWAVSLQDVIADVGLFCANDGFIISPLDLGEIGASASPFWGEGGRPKARN
jgi:hypothetical protein